MNFDINKRKLGLIGLGVAMVIIVLGFVLVSILKKQPVAQEATLEFWGTFDQSSFYQDIFDAYERTHPLVQIKYRQFSFEDYEKSLIGAFAAGTGPDIFLMHNTWLPKHADKITPLTEDITDDSGEQPALTVKDFKEKFADVVVADASDAKGNIYGLPLYVDTLALYYNKDILNSAGITAPPRTWEDFVRIVGILTAKDDRGNITKSAAALGTARNVNRSTDILMLLMLQSGVRMTSGDHASATFGQPVDGLNVGELALQFYTDFANSAKPDRYTWNDNQKYSIDAFADGNTAMMFNYSHHLKTLRAKSPRLNFSVAPMPSPGKANVTVNYANYWMPTVAKQSAHAEEAWRFLVDLATTDAVKTYLAASDRPAARRDLIEAQRTTPELGIFAVQALSARSWYQADNVAIETIFAKLIEDVLFNRFTISAALRQAASDVSVVMGRK